MGNNYVYCLFIIGNVLLLSQKQLRAASKNIEHLEVHAESSSFSSDLGLKADYKQSPPSLGILGKRAVLDTPFSVMDVPHDVFLNQQLRNINDTARYVPSVQLEQRGDPNISRPQSRGFEGDVVANSRIDGLNALITTPYAAEEFDSLTILNGLAGALYGPQNPAGTFDYHLKRPTEKYLKSLTFGWDSGGAPLEAIDGGGYYKRLGYRLNLLNQDGGSFVQGSHIRRDLVSGDINIALDDQSTLELDGSQYSTANRGMPGAFSYNDSINLPKAPNLKKEGYGQAQGGYNTSTSTGLGKLTHHFNQDWSLRLGGLYQNAARDVFTVNNQLLNNQGLYRQNIASAATASDFKLWSNFAYLTGLFHLAMMRHHIHLGSNGYDLSNYNPYTTQSYQLGTASLGSPKRVYSPQPASFGRYRSANTHIQTLIAGDVVDIGQAFSVMGIVSWSWLKSKNWGKSGEKTASYEKNGAFAPTIALIYKPVSYGSVYFTWGQSIQSGPLAPSGSANAGDILSPLKSEEYEVGTKWTILDKLQLNIAAFRMTRPYAFTDPKTYFYTVEGMQRNYGVEFQASGRLTKRLSILGGITWLDPQLGRTGQESTSHKEVVGVPPVMANILLDYRLSFLPRTSVNANIHYTDRRAANVTNSSYAASYVTLDLGARYTQLLYGKRVIIRFGVDNVTGEKYWTSLYPTNVNGAVNASNSAMAGIPRTYHLTLSLAL